MQYRVLDRLTLQYKDGGFVREWSIDNDYINNNNSIVGIVAPAKQAKVGDVIFLIDTAGAYDKGIISSVDNEALQISYKGDKELFNDNILNPLASEFKEDTNIDIFSVDGLPTIKNIIEVYWGKSVDIYKRLPLSILTSGSAEISWTWQETQISFTDWLISLFKDYSIVVSFSIDFNTAERDLTKRKAKYVVMINAVNNDNDVIKDNVKTQTITYTKESLPDKTCCWVVDKESGELINMATKNMFDRTFGYADSVLSDQDGLVYDVGYYGYAENSNVSTYIIVSGSTWYTLSWVDGDTVRRDIVFYDRNGNVIEFDDGNDNIVKSLKYSGVQGNLSFQTPSNAKKIRICYCSTARNIQLEAGQTATQYETNSYKSIYYLYIKDNGEYDITYDSENPNRVLPVRTVYVEYDSNSATENRTVVDVAKNELNVSALNHAIEIEIPRDTKMFDFELAKFGDRYTIITKSGTISSVYSGRKESSKSNVVTLLFGIGRLNFTDLIGDLLRSRHYTKVYR